MALVTAQFVGGVAAPSGITQLCFKVTSCPPKNTHTYYNAQTLLDLGVSKLKIDVYNTGHFALVKETLLDADTFTVIGVLHKALTDDDVRHLKLVLSECSIFYSKVPDEHPQLAYEVDTNNSMSVLTLTCILAYALHVELVLTHTETKAHKQTYEDLLMATITNDAFGRSVLVVSRGKHCDEHVQYL